IAARLLKIVNSPFYGFESGVETVEHALTIVGLNQLTDLVLATVVISQFKSIPKEFITMDSFWEHSVACGLGAKILARHLHMGEPERFYIAGMLHDLGSLSFYKKAPEKSRKVFALSREKKIHLYQAEKEIMGFTHADVGAALLKAWCLPPRLLEIVACHHRPLEARNHSKDAAIVQLADTLAYESELGGSGECFVPERDPKVLVLLDLSQSTLASIQEELQVVFHETIEIFTTSS
ncbi:MAG: HDOD domain-containing protein, partial [Nitrospinae bacterium]|nr:HDOD domain-containing protein [Nitrospinota bacterium]